MATQKIIGIDLGTTKSVVAVMEGDRPVVIPNQQGERLTPTVVAFTERGERLVGAPAKVQAEANPRNTVWSFRRFLGRVCREVAEEEKRVPYRLVGGADEFVRIEAGGRPRTPHELAAMVLRKLADAAERHLGEKAGPAVVTVPAQLFSRERQAIQDAAEIAGLKVVRLISAPTAAALAYGLERKKNEKIAVLDLGGGTFDISILDIGDGVFEVLATSCDPRLAGDDFDQVLIEHLADEFKNEHGIDLRKDPRAHQRLKDATETAKCELSALVETEIELPDTTAGASGPELLRATVTRRQFEGLIGPLLERLRKQCEQTLADARCKPADLDEILLVGGAARMPCLQAMVRDLFGKEPCWRVNPDEAAALGAAIQGGILAGDVKEDVVLEDVLSLSLGIETLGGVATKLIERNTTIPTQKKEVFSTASDNQAAIVVRIIEGEREMAADNRSLGRVRLTGIPPALRGVPQIQVTFDIDANGILNVSAKDLGTHKEQSLVVQSPSGLPRDEIEQLRQELRETG